MVCQCNAPSDFTCLKVMSVHCSYFQILLITTTTVKVVHYEETAQYRYKLRKYYYTDFLDLFHFFQSVL